MLNVNYRKSGVTHLPFAAYREGIHNDIGNLVSSLMLT